MNFPTKQLIEGGCLCGAVRYQIVGTPQSVEHCHCRMCQRASGAPLVTWATYSTEQLTITCGEPRTFQSSPAAARSFCGECGTLLTFQYQGDRQEIDIAVCSLDNPATLTPNYHIWTMSQQPWIHLNDGLPRHEKAEEDSSTSL